MVDLCLLTSLGTPDVGFSVVDFLSSFNGAETATAIKQNNKAILNIFGRL